MGEMAHLLVPSDVTILEKKMRIGTRRMSWMESVGLMTMLPTWHIRYSKMDKKDMRQVLRNKFDPNASDAATALCVARQNAVSRSAKAHTFMWLGVGTFVALPWWSLRRYNYQSKLIVLPFMAYGGSWVGRIVGDGISGVWQQFGRDKILGDLPAKAYQRE